MVTPLGIWRQAPNTTGDDILPCPESGHNSTVGPGHPIASNLRVSHAWIAAALMALSLCRGDRRWCSLALAIAELELPFLMSRRHGIARHSICR